MNFRRFRLSRTLDLNNFSDTFFFSCKDGLTSFTCNCTGTGYEGVLCQDNINECVDTRYLHKCQNDATCMDRESNYSCECKEGFMGTCFLYS